MGIWDEADDKALGISYRLPDDGFIIRKYENSGKNVLAVVGKRTRGIVRVFHLQGRCLGKTLAQVQGIDGLVTLRIINHWDNMSGLSKGYAGQSIFFKDNRIISDLSRIKDYARLLHP